MLFLQDLIHGLLIETLAADGSEPEISRLLAHADGVGAETDVLSETQVLEGSGEELGHRIHLFRRDGEADVVERHGEVKI